MDFVTQGNLKRDRYHHGDLANALTVAATDLARQGGPEAVVLREAARQVGVSATAAYRHFAGHGDLIEEVRDRCQAALAEHMRAELDAGEPLADPRQEAVRRFRALGRGYIRFALAEPGLFRTAFCHAEPAPDKGLETFGSPSFDMLSAMLDELTALGLIEPARRAYTEIAAWSNVHGLATLLVDGPLAVLPPEIREAAIERTMDANIAGICTGF
jgi:AcrR family transcriptional regulator